MESATKLERWTSTPPRTQPGFRTTAILSEIDEVTNTVIHTIAMNDFTSGVAIDTGTHTVYASHPVNDTVSVIDEASSAVTHSIQVSENSLLFRMPTRSRSRSIPAPTRRT